MKYFAAWLAAAASLWMSALVSRQFRDQDILHVYVRSSVTEFYRTYLDTGAGFSEVESAAFFLFPSNPVDGSPRVNFPLPIRTRKLAVAFGETAGDTVSDIRICVERSLFVTRCMQGVNLTRYIERISEAKLAVVGGSTQISALSSRPIVTFSEAFLDALRPDRDVWKGIADLLIFVSLLILFFCFFIALFLPVFAWVTWDALVLLLAAGALRTFAFVKFGQRLVSDSDLFVRYLQVHIFGLPGIRGVVYPIFVSLFQGDAVRIVKAQLVFGAAGSVIVLLLIRSFKAKSHRDLLLALVATSVPTLIAMEDLVLSESFSLFLILSILLMFRWAQMKRGGILSIAGLGVSCSLLAQTKPQFAFVAIVMVLAVCIPFLGGGKRMFALRRFIVFATPSIALYLFATALDFSSGNFRGTSSTLGYSLFDHGQRALVCPTDSANRHTQFFCQARASIGPNADQTEYTAWVIYPSMKYLGEPFFRVTESYAKLSLQLISTNPRLYLQDVLISVLKFWTGDIPMSRSFLMSAYNASPEFQRIMTAIVTSDRIYRDLIVGAFFILIAAAFLYRPSLNQRDLVFVTLMVSVAIVSSVLQAIVEYGRESARFEIPTEPLLTIVVVFATLNIYRQVIRNFRS